jgi:minor extracellular serine protease Vpr
MSAFNIRAAGICAMFLSAAFGQTYSNQYALILKDPPVAVRFVGREAMNSSAAEAHRQVIAAAQQTLREAAVARNITVTGSADVVFNAVFVAASPDRLAELQSLPGVLGVVQMRNVKPWLNTATAMQNAPAAWAALGGQGNAGAGVKVGVLDYGIDITHPAMQDSTLALPTTGGPWPKCTTGHPEDCAFTNTKVIVARSYVRSIAPGSDPTTSRPDDYRPMDREGHGTAVSSVIAANPSKGSVTISGMAPKAWLGMYKIFGSPNVNDAVPESVIIQALNDAVTDGMDVVNFSGGVTAVAGALDTGTACGQAAGVACDPLGSAFENAAKSIVVVVAAGNSGFDGNNFPTLGSISTPGSAPSVIAVGAITNAHFFNPAVSVAGGPSSLQNLAGAAGDDPFEPVGAYTAPVVDVTTLGDDGFGCSSFPASTLNGAFALIQRSVVGSATACAFATKVDNAWSAGAQGVILYMSDASALIGPANLDENGIPVIMISQSDGQNLKAYIKANPGASATIDPSNAEVPDTLDSNLLSFYSSLGPNTGDNAIKPDLVAVGTTVYMAAQTYDAAGGQYSSTRYATADGTSFASPMVAGAAALVKQKHPTWTPAQIRSALINSANTTDVTSDDQGDVVDVEWIGAGKLDANAAVGATVVASPTAASFGLLTAAPSNLNKAFTITNLGSAAVTLTVAVTPGPVSLTGNLTAGIKPAVDKTSLPVAAGGSATLNVSLTGSMPPAGSYSGAITLTGTGVKMTIPYMYLVGGGSTGLYNVTFVGSGGFEGIVGQQPFDPIYPTRPHAVGIKLTDGVGLPVSGTTVTWTVSPRGAVTFGSTSAATDAYGIGAVDLTVRSTGNITVTATVAGQTMSFGGFGWSQPTISVGGVVDAGANRSPIAPGSYVSIYGANLSEFTDSVLFAPNTLPLSIDGVTVSFDVPSANLSYPGHIVFVSPGQINVQVPWELQGQTSAQVKVTLDSFVFGTVVTVPLADSSPTFFTNSGIAAAIGPNGIATAANPVTRGQVVSLYMNGLGPVTGGPASGEYASSTALTPTKNTATVTIGGQPAVVGFSGLAPTFPGLYQVNVTVPTGIATGLVPISVSIGGGTTQPATLPVK